MPDREREADVAAFRAWFERNADDPSEWDERWVDFAHLAGRVLARLPFGNRVLKERVAALKQELAEAERMRDINKRALDDCHSTINKTANDISAVADVLGLRMGQETLLDAAKRVRAAANQPFEVVNFGKHLEGRTDDARGALPGPRKPVPRVRPAPIEPEGMLRKEDVDADELAAIRALLIVPTWPISTLDAVRAKVAECQKWAVEVGRLRTQIAETVAILNRV